MLCGLMPPLSEPTRYLTGNFDRVFVVRWRAFRLEDLAAVRARIAELRHTLARPVVYLSLIPDSPRSFTDAEREALQRYLEDLLSGDCKSIHHVVAGEGFQASARRSIVTNMALGTTRPGAFRTYSTLPDAVAAISDELQIPARDLLEQIAAQGLSFSR
jgi:hypothetical protein